MMPTFDCFTATPAQHRLGNHFLKQHRQATAGKNDLLFLAKASTPSSNEVVGAVWLRPLKAEASASAESAVEDRVESYWIRSLYVTQALRNQGIGRKLLNHALAQCAPLPAYAFIRPERMPFYQALGFAPIPADDLSGTLARKFRQYANSGHNWTVMASKPRVL